MRRHRRATLVVVDRAGSVLGVLGPLRLGTPWWQETELINDQLPQVTVLRLLHAADGDDPGADPTGLMGGEVVYAVEATDPDRPLGDLVPWPGSIRPDLIDLVEGRLEPHHQRHPWAEPGGPAADLAWVADRVPIAGPARQHRTWNLSALWSIPVTGQGRPGSDRVWLKCVPSFFAHEAAVLAALADRPVPQLLATEAHRLLLAAMPGQDGYDPDRSEQVSMIDALVDLQVEAVDRVNELLAGGVPDLRTDHLGSVLSDLVGRFTGSDSPVEPDVVQRLVDLVDGLPERLAAVADCGLPDTLVHGDPHGGNCRRGVDPPVWFDWGDSFIGNPILDLAATHRMNQATVEHWIGRWAEAVPGARPERAWELLVPVAELRMAWVYQRFLDNIEPTEHVYHRHDVVDHLRAAARAAVGSDGD